MMMNLMMNFQIKEKAKEIVSSGIALGLIKPSSAPALNRLEIERVKRAGRLQRYLDKKMAVAND